MSKVLSALGYQPARNVAIVGTDRAESRMKHADWPFGEVGTDESPLVNNIDDWIARLRNREFGWDAL